MGQKYVKGERETLTESIVANESTLQQIKDRWKNLLNVAEARF